MTVQSVVVEAHLHRVSARDDGEIVDNLLAHVGELVPNIPVGQPRGLRTIDGDGLAPVANGHFLDPFRRSTDGTSRTSWTRTWLTVLGDVTEVSWTMPVTLSRLLMGAAFCTLRLVTELGPEALTDNKSADAIRHAVPSVIEPTHQRIVGVQVVVAPVDGLLRLANSVELRLGSDTQEFEGSGGTAQTLLIKIAIQHLDVFGIALKLDRAEKEHAVGDDRTPEC